MGGNSLPTLPNINTWYRDSELDIDDDESICRGEDNDAEELQALVDEEEHTLEPRNNKQDNQTLALTYASLALTADDLVKV